MNPTPSWKAHIRLLISLAIVAIVVISCVYIFATGAAGRKQKIADGLVRPPAPVEIPTTATSGMAFVNAVGSVAVQAASIDVSGCRVSPRAAKMALNSPVTFTNGDSAPHTIAFNPAIRFEVPARGRTDQTVSLLSTPGVHPYSCDSIERAGYIYIQP